MAVGRVVRAWVTLSARLVPGKPRDGRLQVCELLESALDVNAETGAARVSCVSFAVQLTVVVPNSKLLPEAGTQLKSPLHRQDRSP